MGSITARITAHHAKTLLSRAIAIRVFGTLYVLQGFETVASFGAWKTPPLPGARGCLVFDEGPAFGMGDLSFPWKPSFELIYIKGEGWIGPRDEGVLSGHVQNLTGNSVLGAGVA